MKAPEILNSINLVGASAGTGKTTRLAEEFLRAVLGDSEKPPIDPTRIMVCTFTNKAADELASRIRQKLIENGKVDAAHLVLSGYVGTVNSLCGRLLRDYAYEGGLSPKQDVLPEHMSANLFAIASSSVIDAYAQRIEPIARRLSFAETAARSKYQKRAHWIEQVRSICSLARANCLDSAQIEASATRSFQGIRAYLGQAETRFSPDELDELLVLELENAINRIDTGKDTSEATAKALQTLRECFARARNDGMTWRDWASIKKLNPGVASKEAVKNLQAAGAIVHLHPRLHEDLEQYLKGIFECACDCLKAFQSYKSSQGLVDFVDQEYLALKLLDNQDVRESLASRIDLLLIDEFQDTSPIQLSLFLKLAELARRSIWVGDIKQAIYGFRGTDPQLMQAASATFTRLPPLEKSFRSRPQLVSFCNEIFRLVFPAHGIKEEDVLISPAGNRQEAESPAVELWRCHGKDLEACFAALAQGVVEFLNKQDHVEIVDADNGISRHLQGSDLAILCRKNDHCARLAQALSKHGLKVAMIRDGLLDTPECILAIASLRYLIDPSDKIALAQLIHLNHNYKGGDQSQWLCSWLKAGYHPQKLLSKNETFDKARKLLPAATIDDALHLSLEAGSVIDRIQSWGNAAERISNLDALRGLVVEYEITSSIARSPSTITGFLNYLLQLEESDRSASTDNDAVQVLTYHAAKGLEWPVVILTDLDAEASPKVHKDLCRIQVESPESALDLNAPLKDRWLRFWPWPFGAVEKDGDFENNARSSPEYESTCKRVLAENIRLMYVGMTRARDMLILAPYTGREKTDEEGSAWLDELSLNGKAILEFPQNPGAGSINIAQSNHAVFVRSFSACAFTGAAPSIQDEAVYTLASRNTSNDYENITPYSLRPSSLETSSAEIMEDLLRVHDLGERIPIDGKVDMTLLGECVHSFLAVDLPEKTQAERLRIADKLRQNWRINALSSADLLLMGERLEEFLRKEFTSYKKYCECPVSARIELQRMKGNIDLLLEYENGFAIIDHKTFPGPHTDWTKKAMSFTGQLQAYAEAIKEASKKAVHRMFIHMPVVGKIVEFKNASLKHSGSSDGSERI